MGKSCLLAKRDKIRPCIALKTPKTISQHKVSSFRKNLSKFAKFLKSYGGSAGGQKKGKWPFSDLFCVFLQLLRIIEGLSHKIPSYYFLRTLEGLRYTIFQTRVEFALRQVGPLSQNMAKFWGRSTFFQTPLSSDWVMQIKICLDFQKSQR